MSAKSYALTRGVLALAVVFVTACSSRTAPAPALRKPETAEKAVFEGLSSFYCAEQRWPKTWGELVDFEELSDEGRMAVGEMLAAELSSPRAVLLVVRYKSSQGIDRKVTFIAPPSCHEESDDPSLVSMAGGRIIFETPAGFSALGGEAIKNKWRDGPFPDAAWQDASHGAVITVSFGEAQVQPDELEGLRGDLEGAYEASLPSIEWIEKSAALDDDPPKLIHMLSSDSSAGRVVSYGMAMSFDGRLFTLSIAGPLSEQREIEVIADALRRTLQVN